MADEWDQAAEELKSDGPDEWEQAAKAVTGEQRKPDVVTESSPTLGQSAVRLVKQIANVPAELVKGVVTTAVGVPHDLYTQLTTAHAVAADAQTSFFSESQYGRKVAEKVPVAEFDIPEARNTSEKIGDLAVGVGTFALEVSAMKGAALKKLGPAAAKIPDAAYWAYHAIINGQNPAVAYAQGKMFGHVEKLPARSIFEKGLKTLSESGIMYGSARMAGGSQEEAGMAAAVPVAFKAPGMARAVRRMGQKAPEVKPDIVKAAKPDLPEIQEPPVVATAEGTISGPEAKPTDNPVAREHAARLQGEWEHELEQEQRAYDQLQEAVGTKDPTKIKRAQTRYDKAKPLQRSFLQQMSDAGDADATARLGKGLYMPDDVDQTTPLTKQERSAAKRLGFGKTSTGREGWESPGRIRLALQQASEGDQGSTLGVLPIKPVEAKPEAKVDAKPETKAEAKPEAPEGHPAGHEEKKLGLDADIELNEQRINGLQRGTRITSEGQIRLNTFKSARYVLRDFDASTGSDTATWIERVDRRANIEAPDEATSRQREILTKHRLTETDLPTGEVANRIGEALHSGDTSRLSPDEMKFHDAAKEILEYGGELAARRKWQMWKNDTEIPGGIKDDPAMVKQIMEEGKKAESEGKLDEWLKTQPWAKRETYFMSERPQDATAEDSDVLFRDRPPTIAGREARTREAKTKARKTDNLFGDIHDHILNLARSEAANDEIPQIWRRIKKSNLDNPSEKAMKDLLRNVAGLSNPSYGFEQLAVAGKLWFWRLKFLNPRFVYRFTVENLTQLLYMKTHMSTSALAKGTAIVGQQKYAGTRDTFRIKEAERLWGKASRQNQQFVSQLRDAGSEFRRNHPEIWKMTHPVVNLVDTMVHASSAMDPMVRELSWHVYDAAAKDYLTKFQRGEIKWKDVENNIQVKTLHPGQAKEIYYRIKRGEIDKAASIIAESKTSATHARYEITQRSLTEQTKAGRLYTGPLTYIRSIYEMAWQQGVKPMSDGFKHGDYNLAYRGFKNLMFLGVGYYTASKVFEKATGRYAPVAAGLLIGQSPGLDFLMGPLEDVSQIAWQADSQQWTTAQQVDATVNKLAGRLEQTIPLADIMADYYEKQHNVAGVRLWSLVKSKLRHKWAVKYHKQWTPAGRTELEGWMHVVTGGFEQGEQKIEQQRSRQEAKGL